MGWGNGITICTFNNEDISKVIVGGTPVTKSYAMDIGVMGYAADVGGDIKVIKHLLAT